MSISAIGRVIVAGQLPEGPNRAERLEAGRGHLRGTTLDRAQPLRPQWLQPRYGLVCEFRPQIGHL